MIQTFFAVRKIRSRISYCCAEKEEKENKAEEEAKKAEEAESERYMRLMAEFQNFKRKAYIHTFFTAAGDRKIVGYNSFSHYYVIKHTFVEQYLAGVCFHCRKSASEIMTINDLTEFRICFFNF